MKVLLISHRGNLNGPNPTRENNPDYIGSVLKFGFNCEIDVRLINGTFWLGHDDIQYQVKQKYLMNDKLWLHCKDLMSLTILKDIHPNVFYHTNENFVLTSGGKIWTCDPINLNNQCILMSATATSNKIINSNFYGICSDYIQKFV